MPSVSVRESAGRRSGQIDTKTLFNVIMWAAIIIIALILLAKYGYPLVKKIVTSLVDWAKGIFF